MANTKKTCPILNAKILKNNKEYAVATDINITLIILLHAIALALYFRLLKRCTIAYNGTTNIPPQVAIANKSNKMRQWVKLDKKVITLRLDVVDILGVSCLIPK